MEFKCASARAEFVAAVALVLVAGCGSSQPVNPGTKFAPTTVLPGAAGAPAVVTPPPATSGPAVSAPTPAATTSPVAPVPTSSGVAGKAAGPSTTGGAGMVGTMATGTGGGAAPMAGSAAGGSGAGAPMGKGDCCPDGNCLCHGTAPTSLAMAYKAGPYKTMSYSISTGTVYYPTDAEPPLAAIAICPGFLNTGPEMAPWGPYYASYGIVLVATNTGAADIPDIRAGLLLDSVKALKAENMKMGSPLFGKLSGRYGTSGYSMGGGGTTIAASQDATLKISIGLAPWGGTGAGVKVPTLLMCGDADTVAPCDMAQGDYTGMAGDTPKMLLVLKGSTHFNWFGPADGEGGKSGAAALAFAKVYLEGDVRWKPLLTMAGGTTNIK
jgi:hypothetical protein